MEDYTTNFTTMLGGNADAAKAKVAELAKFAASTPFGMDTLAQGTQTLLAFGVASEKSTDILRMLGDVALGDAAKMQIMANAFGKASASGKVTGEVVQSMIGAGFNPLLVISAKTGESMEQLQKRMAAGKVTVEELEEAFRTATSEGGQFYKGMENASQTLTGMLSTLSDNWAALQGKLTAPFYKIYEQQVVPALLAGVSSLTEFVDNNQDKLEAFGEQIGGIAESIINGLVAALQWVLDNGDKIGPIVTAIGIGLGALFAVMNPIPAIIALVTAGVVALIANWDSIKAAAATAVEFVITWAEDTAEKVVEWASGVWSAFTGAIGAAVSLVVSWAQDTAAKVSEWASGVWSAFTGAIGAAVSLVVSWAQDTAAKVSEWASGVWSAFTGAIGTAVSLVVSWAQDTAEKAGTWAQGVWESVTQWTKTTFKIGVEGAAGVIARIDEWWTNVLAAVKAFFKAVFEVDSPDFDLKTWWDGVVAAAVNLATAWILNNPVFDLLTWWTGKIKDVVINKKWDLLNPEGIAESIKKWWDENKPSLSLGFTLYPVASTATGDLQDAVKSGAVTWDDINDNLIPQHAAGLDFVPRDNYLSYLHQGEAVLTRKEADAWRAGRGAAANEGISAEAIGQAVAAALAGVLNGMTVSMDGQEVGRMVAPSVNTYIGYMTKTRRYAGV